MGMLWHQFLILPEIAKYRVKRTHNLKMGFYIAPKGNGVFKQEISQSFKATTGQIPFDVLKLSQTTPLKEI